MRHLPVLISVFAVFSIAESACAAPLDGRFNTGPSLEKEASGGSLNIAFHPCTDEPSRRCASILEMVEPAGPSGLTTLPNGEPVVGFVFIRDLKPKGEGRWRDGKILAVDESLIKGKMIWYGLKIDANADGSLAATGCLGFICPREMTWAKSPAASGDSR